jgi:hypothetical protein
MSIHVKDKPPKDQLDQLAQVLSVQGNMVYKSTAVGSISLDTLYLIRELLENWPTSIEDLFLRAKRWEPKLEVTRIK